MANKRIRPAGQVRILKQNLGISINYLQKNLSKKLVKGLEDPAFNISECVLDFYHQTLKEWSNHTAQHIEGNMKKEYGNFLSLFGGVVYGFFGNEIKDYGDLLVKYLNIFNDFDIGSKSDERIRPIFMEKFNQLFTVPGEDVSLIDAAYLYSLNDLNDFQNPSDASYEMVTANNILFNEKQ